jgi:RNA polymerase sigma-70 factor (ECF subfamily)
MQVLFWKKVELVELFDIKQSLRHRKTVAKARQGGPRQLLTAGFCAKVEHFPGTAGVEETAARPFRVELPPMGDGDADAQLMLRYAGGDARAFDALYEAHRRALWRFIRRSVPDAAATDDVFQECWSRVIAHRESYRPEARFATWLYRIAHNCCMDHWRRSGRRGTRETADEDAVLEAAGDAASGPLEMALQGEAGERLAAALDRLPREQRAAFLLYVEGGLTVAEIGQATGVNPETAKSRLRYAVTRLKQALGDAAPD